MAKQRSEGGKEQAEKAVLTVPENLDPSLIDSESEAAKKIASKIELFFSKGYAAMEQYVKNLNGFRVALEIQAASNKKLKSLITKAFGSDVKPEALSADLAKLKKERGDEAAATFEMMAAKLERCVRIFEQAKEQSEADEEESDETNKVEALQKYLNAHYGELRDAELLPQNYSLRLPKKDDEEARNTAAGKKLGYMRALVKAADKADEYKSVVPTVEEARERALADGEAIRDFNGRLELILNQTEKIAKEKFGDSEKDVKNTLQVAKNRYFNEIYEKTWPIRTVDAAILYIEPRLERLKKASLVPESYSMPSPDEFENNKKRETKFIGFANFLRNSLVEAESLQDKIEPVKDLVEYKKYLKSIDVKVPPKAKHRDIVVLATREKATREQNFTRREALLVADITQKRSYEQYLKKQLTEKELEEASAEAVTFLDENRDRMVLAGIVHYTFSVDDFVDKMTPKDVVTFVNKWKNDLARAEALSQEVKQVVFPEANNMLRAMQKNIPENEKVNPETAVYYATLYKLEADGKKLADARLAASMNRNKFRFNQALMNGKFTATTIEECREYLLRLYRFEEQVEGSRKRGAIRGEKDGGIDLTALEQKNEKHLGELLEDGIATIAKGVPQFKFTFSQLSPNATTRGEKRLLMQIFILEARQSGNCEVEVRKENDEEVVYLKKEGWTVDENFGKKGDGPTYTETEWSKLDTDQATLLYAILQKMHEAPPKGPDETDEEHEKRLMRAVKLVDGYQELYITPSSEKGIVEFVLANNGTQTDVDIVKAAVDSADQEVDAIGTEGAMESSEIAGEEMDEAELTQQAVVQDAVVAAEAVPAVVLAPATNGASEQLDVEEVLGGLEEAEGEDEDDEALGDEADVIVPDENAVVPAENAKLVAEAKVKSEVKAAKAEKGSSGVLLDMQVPYVALENWKIRFASEVAGIDKVIAACLEEDINDARSLLAALDLADENKAVAKFYISKYKPPAGVRFDREEALKLFE